jgi:hypothetical protein
LKAPPGWRFSHFSQSGRPATFETSMSGVTFGDRPDAFARRADVVERDQFHLLKPKPTSLKPPKPKAQSLKPKLNAPFAADRFARGRRQGSVFLKESGGPRQEA